MHSKVVTVPLISSSKAVRAGHVLQSTNVKYMHTALPEMGIFFLFIRMFNNLIKSLAPIPTNASTMLTARRYLAWKRYFFIV